MPDPTNPLVTAVVDKALEWEHATQSRSPGVLAAMRAVLESARALRLAREEAVKQTAKPCLVPARGDDHDGNDNHL